MAIVGPQLCSRSWFQTTSTTAMIVWLLSLTTEHERIPSSNVEKWTQVIMHPQQHTYLGDDVRPSAQEGFEMLEPLLYMKWCISAISPASLV